MGKRKALKNQGSEFRKDMKNGGGHWFHTEEELDFFRNWLRERL